MRIVPSLVIVTVVMLTAGCHEKTTQTPAAKNPGAHAVSPQPGLADDGPTVEDAAADEQRAQAELANTGDKRPALVCFGDSLTAGLGVGQGQSYPDDLQRDLDALGHDYRVVNQGVSGNTTKDGIARLKDVLSLKPEIAVVEFGGNDGLRGLPVSETETNLDQIVRTLKAAGVRVALAGITLPPDYGEDYIRRFDAMYAQIAKKCDVPMLPFLLKDVYGEPGMMQRDQTHATAKGNEQVARNVLGLVRPLLRKK